MNKKKSYITFLNIFILLAVLFVANNAESAENNDKLENYYKEMRSFLMSYWSLSAGYKKEPGGLSATLKITINERGKVLSYELINKSGDKVFDDACISTVEKIKKFPKPPTDIWLFTLKEGLILKFKPSSVQFNFGRPSKFCHTMNEKIDNEGYKELSSNLKRANPETIISVDVNATVVIKDKAYNMTQIGKAVDQVIIMAYDYRQQNSTRAGPVAPIKGKLNEHSILESVESLSGRVPNDKLILAIPFYGYEWQTVGREHKSPVIEGTGALATYKRVKKLLTDRSDITVNWDDISKSPWLYYMQYGAVKQIYYENDRSISEKIKFIKEKNMGGLAVWALGYEGNNTEPWKIIEKINED